MLVDLVALKRSLILVNHRPERGFGVRRQIHVWWGGIGGNGGLMLLIAFLLRSHNRWAGSTVTLLTVVGTGAQQDEVEHNAREVLRAARIHADVHVINAPGRPIIDIMRENSAHSDLAIVGVGRPHARDDANVFFDRTNRILEVLPTTLLVCSSRDFESEPMLLDEHESESSPNNPPPDKN